MNLENFPVVLPCKVYNIRVMSLNKISKKKKKKRVNSLLKKSRIKHKKPHHVSKQCSYQNITCLLNILLTV